jgi:hypothetical protein
MKKKPLMLIACYVVALNTLFAQVTKTVAVSAPGKLSSMLTNDELNKTTDLTVTGRIDSSDFVTMKNMCYLENIDLKKATVNKNYIPSLAFAFKTSLKSIILPTSVTRIGQAAFLNCSGLKSVVLPQALNSLSASAFINCSGLTEITLPASLKSIGGGALLGCDGLTSVTVPSSVTYIGGSAFGPSNHIKVNVDAANSNFSSVDGVLLNKDKTPITDPAGKPGKNP